MTNPVQLVSLVVSWAATLVVPGSLGLLFPRDRDGRADRWLVRLRVVLAIAGLSVVPAVLDRRFGPLAFVWLAGTILLAGAAAARALGRSRWRLEEVAITLGALYLPVGAAWLAAYANGWTVMGFSGLSCLLTATHFHYAGFGACVLVGALGRGISGRAATVYRPIALAMMAGIALLAMGIAFSRPLELGAAWLVAIATLGLGLLLLRHAFVTHVWVARVAAAFAGVSGTVAALLAAHFALVGFASLDGGSVVRMVRLHGLVNAFGLVSAGLLAVVLASSPSRASPTSMPTSRLFARGRVGASFFEQLGAVDGDGEASGLSDDFTAYLEDGASIAPELVAFYERTVDFELDVVPRWQPGFGLAGRLWSAFAQRIGQLNLPVDASGRLPVRSRIVKLRDELDGRSSVRAWVRTHLGPDGGDGEPIYVAAYASHVLDGRRYMNIAFPLPAANLTSILRVTRRGGGVSLTTLADGGAPRDGDQGVYLVTKLGPIRLPLDETIDVWPSGTGEPLETPEGIDRTRVALFARHDMWLLGLHYLRLEYFLRRRPVTHAETASSAMLAP